MSQHFFFVLLLFIISLLLAMGTSAWFARRLEASCEALNFPPSLLSLLGALGANIPNYVASIVAIADGKLDIGLGIIIGSNIYNIAIILAIATFATPKHHGIILTIKQASDVRIVAGYTLAMMLTTLVSTWLLPGTPLVVGIQPPFLTSTLLIVVVLSTLGLFALLVLHAIQRELHPDASDERQSVRVSRFSLIRWIGEAVLALAIALGGVVVMVQSGQDLTLALGIPQVLVGLLVLAVATSLPNTVVAYILARTDRETACVEEILSSNSINAAFGIALPLLFWHLLLHDRLLLFLDAPLMVILTFGALLCVLRRRVSRPIGVLLLLVYAAWVVLHILV